MSVCLQLPLPQPHAQEQEEQPKEEYYAPIQNQPPHPTPTDTVPASSVTNSINIECSSSANSLLSTVQKCHILIPEGLKSSFGTIG